jgi:hypothetical protein
MLVSDLILAVLPRVGRADKNSGISIFGAANSLQSLIFKNLLRSKSDLLVTGQLNLSIPAFGYSATLPDDFLSPAERLRTEELMDDWMAGTVTSYNNTTGALVVSISLANGTDVLSYWDIALGPTPGSPASNIANSTTSLTCGTGTQSLNTQAGLNLQVGQYIILSSAVSPNGWEGRRRILEPNYLGDDENDHERWWEYYGYYGVWDAPYHKPRTYTIVGSTVYIRPKPTVDVLLKGKYNQIPLTLSLPTQAIPWQGKFDELFKEGVVRIMARGTATLEADQEFMAFFAIEYESVMISRGRLIPAKRRTHRSNFM